MKLQSESDDNDLAEAIEEIETLESDRPSVEVNIHEPKRSFVPKALETRTGKIVAVIVAAGTIAGAIAETLHQLLSKH